MALSHLDETLFESFTEEALKKREIFKYPPYSRMINLLVKSHEEQTGDRLINRSFRAFNELKEKWSSFSEVTLLGPSPAPIQMIRREYRFQMMLKFPIHLPHQDFIKEGLRLIGKLPPRTKLSVNIDPIDLM
jgi:primosomal protein N' (replication factor Y)